MNEYQAKADRVVALHSQGINLRAAQNLAEAQAIIKEQKQYIADVKAQVTFLTVCCVGLLFALCVLIEEYVS